MIETCLAFPLLALFIFGLFNVIKTYSTTIPVSNASYQLALVGSEYLPEAGDARIMDRAFRLVTQHNSPLNSVRPESFNVQASYDEQHGLLRVRSSGSTSASIGHYMNLGSSYEVVAPILAKRVITSTSDAFTSDPLCQSGYGCDLSCSTYADCTPTQNTPGNPPTDLIPSGGSVDIDSDRVGNKILTKNLREVAEFQEAMRTQLPNVIPEFKGGAGFEGGTDLEGAEGIEAFYRAP